MNVLVSALVIVVNVSGESSKVRLTHAYERLVNS